MKFPEVHAPFLSLRVKAKDGQPLFEALLPSAKKNATAPATEDIPLRTVQLAPVRGEFDLLSKEGFATVVPLHAGDIYPLTEWLASGRSVIARLANPGTDGSADLELLRFFGELLEMGNLEIGIDEKVISALWTKMPEEKNLDDAARKLFGQCVLRHGGQACFFLLAGAAAASELEAGEDSGNGHDSEEESKTDDPSANDSPDDDADEEDEDDEDEDEDDDSDGEPQPPPRRKFAILGADYRLAVEEKDKGNGQTLFLVSHVTRLRNRREESYLRLARGNLVFKDWTAAGERAVLARMQLERLTENTGSYLRKWDEFGDMEGNVFLERARRVGSIPFDVQDESRDGIVTVRCKGLSGEQKDALGALQEVGLVRHDERPEFLDNPQMTFPEFVAGVIPDEPEEDILGKRARKKSRPEGRENALILKVAGFNPADGSLRLKAQTAISPELDTIIFPLAGEIAQIKRRLAARKAIQTGRSANPDLGLLIEEDGQIPARQSPPEMVALSAFVKQKVFPKNPPTLSQEEAIRVALNTPDIALIQGPPGTGKTTVIAAIVERLHEESDKRGSESGRVLLTGFQHDAVENLIERLTINGLPVPKFGHRPGEDTDGFQVFSRLENQLREWCNERIDALRKRNPQIARVKEEDELRASCAQYAQAPSLELAISLMRNSLRLPDFTLGQDLRRRLQAELAELERLKAERDGERPDNPALGTVRSLRTKAAGFADDGPDRAADVLARLGNDLAESDRELLAQAKKCPAGQVPPFLDDLRKLKGCLLARFTPAPEFQKEKKRESVIDLTTETRQRIRANGLSARNKKTAALAEMLMEMENNPAGILDAVRDYSFAFAATCQQSVNRLMQDMKGIGAGQPGEQLAYDCVIVDEAARVGPRDLMIPMAQGKRIILVGDHRQLPHLIDEDIADRLEHDDSDGPSERNLVGDQGQLPHSADGENPGRMDHDDAGEPSESDWIKKSMFEYLFTERLPKLEKADGIQRRVTLDKQFRMHPLLGEFVSRNFYERFNQDEAFASGLPESAFAHDLPDTGGKCAVWLDVPFRGGDMTRSGTSWTRPAEIEAICAQLKKWIDHDDRREDGKRLTFGVIAFYKAQAEAIQRRLGAPYLETVGARLRIGTVDSFQGREFDVVFLSPVRTGKRGFGFLQLSNRLNVAMSRQKKLLAVAGDAAFFQTEAAREKVPGLANFLKLCRDKGAVL